VKGELRILGIKGDTKVTWDSEVATEVEQAKKSFKSYLDKGFAAFRVTKKGGKGTQITDFDSIAEEILFVPPLRGGGMG